MAVLRISPNVLGQLLDLPEGVTVEKVTVDTEGQLGLVINGTYQTEEGEVTLPGDLTDVRAFYEGQRATLDAEGEEVVLKLLALHPVE